MKNSIDLVRQLVNDFKTHEATYLAPDYQEQEARKDFIDKFLIALGWDVNHERQKNPYEQEVKIEQSVKTGKSQRRADYAFFIGPNFRDPKFFVEAKKPSRSLSNPDDYYQIIRYAYNKKIPISVLTDFEEFHIIDCRFMPDIKTALSRKIDYFHYSDYADEEKFSRLFHLFGREAVEKGSIEKYAAELPKPKGKGVQQASFKGGFLSIDEAFLEKLDDFRLTLAKSFKKHNQELESEELTEAVQRTIDRLVFIRFLEDKNIEERHIENLTLSPSPLKGEGRGEVWKAFVALCRSLEPKYNGLVFKHHALIDGDKFVPPEEEFAEICSELADPSSPYLFDEIPISILGSIYERFLGKVVHATPKRADVEDKPEVRKAGGVYYTPEYIVRYIVQNTVGKLLRTRDASTSLSMPRGKESGSLSPERSEGNFEGTPDNSFGKTPEEISQMAFADIACGSGSFLIEVYSELLDYHTRYYSAYPEKAKPGDTQMRDGKVVLSLKKRQEILVNNIYGVDIDYQATEVTQLSLYLKLLEDVTMNDAYQYSLLKEKILPDLKQNIVCGNSLIGTDILEGDLFEKTEERKLNPMNFNDAFPKVMKRGGFDAIVGNPPYVSQELSNVERNYYSRAYPESTIGKPNTYRLFLHKSQRSIKHLGMLGYIIPNTYLTDRDSQKIREMLLRNVSMKEILFFPESLKVFANVTQATTVLIFEKDQFNCLENIVRIVDPVENTMSLSDNNFKEFRQANFLTIPENMIITKRSLKQIEIIERLTEKCEPFESFVDVYQGEVNVSINKDIIDITQKTKKYRPLIRGNNISRYFVDLSFNDDKGSWVDASSNFRNHHTFKRIVTQEVSNMQQQRRLNGMIISEGIFVGHTANYLLLKTELYSISFFIGLLNSYLLDFVFQTFNSTNHIPARELKRLPVPKINFSDPSDKSRYDHIVKLVEQMLSAKEKLASAKLESEKDRLELLCSSLDRQIDEAVYELYGLTPEEIKIVEGEG